MGIICAVESEGCGSGCCQNSGYLRGVSGQQSNSIALSDTGSRGKFDMGRSDRGFIPHTDCLVCSCERQPRCATGPDLGGADGVRFEDVVGFDEDGNVVLKSHECDGSLSIQGGGDRLSRVSRPVGSFVGSGLRGFSVSGCQSGELLLLVAELTLVGPVGAVWQREWEMKPFRDGGIVGIVNCLLGGLLLSSDLCRCACRVGLAVLRQPLFCLSHHVGRGFLQLTK